MFSHSSGGVSSGTPTLLPSTPADEAGAAGAMDTSSIDSGGATSDSGGASSGGAASGGVASGGTASGGAAPVASAGGPDAAGTSGQMPPVCMPMPEQCNGLDDDCDDVVDEGCPTLSPGSVVQRRALGDSVGGTDFSDSCANNEVLVGLRVGVGAWVDQITPVCQTYFLRSITQTVPAQYSFALGTKRDLTAHPPTTTSEIQELTCRDGTVMVGVHISQQHTAFDDDTDQVVVPQIWLDCAAPILNIAAAPAQLQWQNIEHVGPATGSFAAPDAWFESDTLDVTQVLVGFHGAAGAWIDRVGLTASSLSVALESG
jgi:hypothetical protein